jgi:hypothetical protein
MVLSSNPSTSCGPSLEIDWVPHGTKTIDVDEYEARRCPRRNQNELLIPRDMRTNRLLESGYTMREINEVTALRRSKKGSSPGRKRFIKKIKSVFST